MDDTSSRPIASSAITDISAQELDQLWLVIDSASSSEALSPVERVHETIESPLRTTSVTKARDASSSGPLSPDVLALRRKTNSASMRRAAQRKKLEFQHLREQVELLEKKLKELQCVVNDSNETRAADVPETAGSTSARLGLVQRVSSSSSSSSSFSSRPHLRTDHDIQELLQLIQTYQHEQLNLHHAIQRHEKTAATLSQLLDASRSLVFGSTSIYAGMHQADDDFAWVNAVLPFLPVFSKARVNDLVRESYLEIVRYFALAETLPPSSEPVMGWSSRQCLANGWVDFVYSKDFPDIDLETLVARTWDNYASTEKNVQLREATYKVLERLDDNTLVMAKNLRADRFYHALFVLIRVRTPTGYIIANRSVSPLPQYEQRFMAALGGSRAYMFQFYGMSLTRLDEQSSSGRGCRVKMCGHAGNGTPVLAQTLATAAVFILLNWESRCVKPMRLLHAPE